MINPTTTEETERMINRNDVAILAAQKRVDRHKELITACHKSLRHKATTARSGILRVIKSVIADGAGINDCKLEVIADALDLIVETVHTMEMDVGNCE